MGNKTSLEYTKDRYLVELPRSIIVDKAWFRGKELYWDLNPQGQLKLREKP